LRSIQTGAILCVMTSKLAAIAFVSALFLAIPALAEGPAVSTGAPTPVVTASVSAGMALAELGRPGFDRAPARLEGAASGGDAQGQSDGSSGAAGGRSWHIALNAACWLLGLVALGLSRVSQPRRAGAWHGSASVSHHALAASTLSGAGRLEIGS